MTSFLDVTATISGNQFQFRCPHCASSHVWSAEQVMSMPDAWIADHCARCGGGVRVWKPSDAQEVASKAEPTPDVSEATTMRAGRESGSPNGYRYKVVPFIGRSTGDLSAGAVAAQLESAIQQHANAGWEFLQLGDVNVEVQPGCVAGLLGAKVQYVRFDQIVFRRRI